MPVTKDKETCTVRTLTGIATVPVTEVAEVVGGIRIVSLCQVLPRLAYGAELPCLAEADLLHPEALMTFLQVVKALAVTIPMLPLEKVTGFAPSQRKLTFL